jgi:RNA polymerase sigma factor (sigma-70 family)
LTCCNINQTGFDTIYQEHHQWLVKWISRRTIGLDNSQDLAQDTFINLLERDNLPEGIRSPKAWLAKIAGNLMVDQARRQILERNYLSMLVILPEAEQPSPDQQLLILALLERIGDILSGLKVIEKKAFLMVRLDGMSYKEVSVELNVSVSSVEKYIAKAMLNCYCVMYSIS